MALPVVTQKRKKDVPSQILNMLQQRQKTNAKSSNTDEDDDTKFLLSFRSYMRKMNHRQKIDFQLGMLQLVKKVTTGNETSSPESQYMYCDNSSGSLPSPRSAHSSYTPVPQSSPYNSSPSPTYVPSLQRNVYVPRNSPVYYKSPSPSESTIHSSSQQQNVPYPSTSKPKLVIHSVTNVTPSYSTTQQNPMQDHPVTSVENNEAAQFLILQSEGSQENLDNIHNYLKFK